VGKTPKVMHKHGESVSGQWWNTKLGASHWLGH